MAVYKSGTGTRGRGHGDACVGTWDLGTRDEGLEDISMERGDVWDGDAGNSNTGMQGMIMIISKVRGECDVSFFVKICYLVNIRYHLEHLMMFTQNISL